MKKIAGIVQEHMYTEDELQRFESGLKEIYREHYDASQPVTVLWMVMPKGYAYSERKMSEATIVIIEVDEEITQEKREGLMDLFSQYLLKNFNVSPLDSLITVANTSFVNQFFVAQQKRYASTS